MVWEWVVVAVAAVIPVFLVWVAGPMGGNRAIRLAAAFHPGVGTRRNEGANPQA